MINVNRRKVESLLSESYGINLKVTGDQEHLCLRLNDLEFGQGFSIIVKSEWRFLTAEFIHDNFSALLLKTMGNSPHSKKELFKSLSIKHTTYYSNLMMKVNGELVDPCVPEKWEEKWLKLQLKLTSLPVVQTKLKENSFEDKVIKILGDLLGLVLSLLPVEENIIEENGNIGLPEGALTKIEVNRYERSLVNRQNCLLLKGCKCNVCDFDFEKIYGAIGKNFIHVHHIVPISELGTGYEVNPEKDLVPLCPNCHAMIHKRNPPYTISELKLIIDENKTDI